MGKIVKYLTPYWKSVIVVVLLLVIQAYCDLALPTYTSNIIDTGIQNKGVEHVVPYSITAEDHAEAKLFMTADEVETWEKIYKKEGEIYSLNTTDEEELDQLDDRLIIPLVMNYQADQITEEEMAALAQSIQTVQSPAEIRGQMEQTVETIGRETLLAMGFAYAADAMTTAGMDMNQLQMDYLWTAGGRMLLMALVMLAVAIAVSYFAARVGAGIGKNLRAKIFHKVMSFSSGEMDRFSTASLITRNTNDVQQIQTVAIMLLRMLLYSPILALGGIYKVWQTGANMGYIIALAVVVLMGFIFLLVSIAMPKFKIMQKLVDNVNLVSREILTGLSVIRAFGREKKEEARFDIANRELKDTQLFTGRVMTFMMPGMTLLMNGLVVLITWVSAHRIDEGTLQVGVMTAFITYSMLIVMSFLMMTMLAILVPRAAVAAERIDEVLQTENSIKESDAPKSIKDGKGLLEFRNVSFRYPDAEEDVLHDLSFTAEPGKVTAIIGSTGAGKSTLVNLIPRFFDATEGEILLDGVNIKDLRLEELRDTIGFVPQKGVLFSGTIASNLRFGDSDATEEDITKAAEVAQAMEFINEKDEHFDTPIAQGGSNVSGGQKQRLSIARAIVKNPKIFVFDDSFSALDMKTDAKLRKALSKHVNQAAEIVVAQRISTILHADQILVLDDGEIVGKGTHSQLMQDCEVYRQIAASQLSAKELEVSIHG
ncbi:MAG: ABC transporter ATP-binding protein [Firmicutes bacterium]|nr:ABC transporter ATP-binding protein [Bacillota bacterium]